MTLFGVNLFQDKTLNTGNTEFTAFIFLGLVLLIIKHLKKD